MITSLTKNQYEILVRMTDENCFYYRYFEHQIGIDRKALKHEMDYLRYLGLVEHTKGLFNDDGEVAGSGFCLKYEGLKIVEKLVNKYEEENEITRNIDEY